MDIGIFVLKLLQSGFGNLAAYLAAHVLLCLVPAFFIAGAMTALIPKEMVTRFLGRNRPKYISYPAAVASASLLAVCSCTIVPLFAGIYKKGAGIGPAMTFLFFAPAANILALIYTGAVIGPDFALARFILSMTFGVCIGILMALIFRKADIQHDEATDVLFSAKGTMNKFSVMLIGVMVALLLSGTLKINLLTNTYFTIKLPIRWIYNFQRWLQTIIPFDTSKGEEGLSSQGVLLIILMVVIGFSAHKGIKNILEGLNKWMTAALLLVSLTLLTASIGIIPNENGVEILIGGKFFGVLASLLVISWIVIKMIEKEAVCNFLWETWKFVTQIFPLLIVGVFAVGVIRELIRPEWIETVAGKNTFLGNVAGVIFGIFMYFPTLVEVPIAKMFLNLGMHRGPLLAYLMADPELSLQSILITIKIIGKKKTFTYVGIVAAFSTLSGMIYGMFIDGVNIIKIITFIIFVLVILIISAWIMSKKTKKIS